jgi:hypothetical protein
MFLHFSSYADWDIEFDKSEWSSIKRVSVDDKHNVIGSLYASIKQPEHFVKQFGMINFDRNNNRTFVKDVVTFIDQLFMKYDFYKLRWSCITDNPATKLYYKFIKDVGGRIIGIADKEILLMDNKLYDVVYYEIHKNNYEKFRTCWLEKMRCNHIL